MKSKLAALFALVLALVSSCVTQAGEKEDHADTMRRFVRDIALYARSYNPGFIIIPQNGAELAFNGENPEEGADKAYLEAVDGFGIEELFYDGGLNIDEYRLSMLRILVNSKPVFVSDYCARDGDVSDAEKKSVNEGFIPFVRRQDNYHYQNIPPGPIPQENDRDIASLDEAENFLYLIGAADYADKAELLRAVGSVNYDAVLIDLFYNGEPLTPEEVASLKTKANGKRRLAIAYISVGSAENYRYYWRAEWRKGKPRWLRKGYSGYPDEYWVEYWNNEWRAIIFGDDESYIKRIIDAGFDGAYLDNVEAYYFLEHEG